MWTARAAAVAALGVAACDPPEEMKHEPPPAQTDEAQQHWQQLADCLIGEPLADGEQASQRMRRIDLWIFSNFSIPETLNDWPASCRKHADALGEAIAKDPQPYDALARPLDTIRRASSVTVYRERGRSGLVVDDVFAGALAVGLRHDATGEKKPAADPLIARDLKPLGGSSTKPETIRCTVAFGELRCDGTSGEQPLDRVDCAGVPSATTPVPTLSPALGKLREALLEMQTCTSAGVTAVALHSPVEEDAPAETKTRVAIAFHDAEGWHAPVETEVAPVQGRWNRGAMHTGLFEPRLDCHGKEATLTWARRDRKVGQLRCTPGGCSSATSGAFPLIGSLHELVLADVGGQVLAAWVVADPTRLTGNTRALMLKLAPIDEVAKGGWRVVVGDDGPWMPIETLAVLSADDAAALLFGGGAVPYGVRVDPRGDLSAYAPEWFRGATKNRRPMMSRGDAYYTLDELMQSGQSGQRRELDRLGESQWTLCGPGGDNCLCLEPLDCARDGHCITFEENLAAFRKALASKGERTVSCERAEVGRCGAFRYFLFEGDIHRYELRWFDAQGSLVGQRNTTDYAEYCGGQTSVIYRGDLPRCTKVVSEELLCGEARPPLAPPLEDLQPRDWNPGR